MKKLLCVLAGIILLAAVGIGFLVSGNKPEPFPEGSQSALWLETGPYTVASFEEAFVDSSRPTDANGDYAGAPERTLDGKVWYPQGETGAVPLIVYSHGFTSSREGGAYIAEHLASHGYVVVAVNYPLTNMNAPGGPNVKDVVNQPADVSFLIDTLLARSASSDNALSGLIDADRVGVTGISLGGLTSTLAAFHPEWADSRIKVALSIAGPTALFTPDFYRFNDVPFLMLAGDLDAIVPYPTNAAPIPAVGPGGELVTLANGSHTGFAGPAAALAWMDNPDALGCYMVLNNVDEGDADSWYDLLGTPEQGINYDYQDELCLMDPLPEAMNVLRQHMITAVVVLSYFESKFAQDVVRKADARRFLFDDLPREAGEVTVTSAADALAAGSAGQ